MPPRKQGKLVGEQPSSDLSKLTDQELIKRRRKLVSTVKKEGHSLKRAKTALFDYEKATQSFLEDTREMVSIRDKQLEKELRQPERHRSRARFDDNCSYWAARMKIANGVVDTMNEGTEAVQKQEEAYGNDFEGAVAEEGEIIEELTKRRSLETNRKRDKKKSKKL